MWTVRFLKSYLNWISVFCTPLIATLLEKSCSYHNETEIIPLNSPGGSTLQWGVEWGVMCLVPLIGLFSFCDLLRSVVSFCLFLLWTCFFLNYVCYADVRADELEEHEWRVSVRRLHYVVSTNPTTEWSGGQFSLLLTDWSRVFCTIALFPLQQQILFIIIANTNFIHRDKDCHDKDTVSCVRQGPVLSEI